MSHTQLEAFLLAASSCAHAMLENAMFIEKELPTLAVPEPFQSQISQVCSALVGTKHDIITEVFELHELREHGEPPGSITVQRRVERIVAWLGEELPKLHALVQALEAATETRSPTSGAYILVAESATNVYRTYEHVSLAADKYREAVRSNAGA